MAAPTPRQPLGRRRLLAATAGLAGFVLAAACSPPRPPAPSPTPRLPAGQPADAPAGPPPAPAPIPTASPAAPWPTPGPRPARGPASVSAPATPPVELRLATNHAAVELPSFRKVLDTFARRLPPVSVAQVNVAARYLEQVPTWAAEGGLPDALFVRASHAGAWAYRRWLVGVGERLARDAQEVEPGDFHPAQVAELQDQDDWLALPHDYSVTALYCRSEHLTEVGLRPSDDWSSAELLAAARQLTRRQGERVVRWGVNWRPDAAALAGVWLADGGSFLATSPATGRPGIAVDTPENARTLQWLADLSAVEGVAPPADEAPPGPGLFAAGRVSLEAGGSWAAALYRSLLAPWVYSPAEPAREGGRPRLELAALPLGATGRRALLGTGSGWALSRDARERDLAWELIKHLASRDSLEVLLALPVRNLPGRLSAMALWLESLRAIGAPGRPEVFERSARESFSLRPVPWWLDYQDACDELLPPLWSGRRRAGEVLPELERRVNQAAAKLV